MLQVPLWRSASQCMSSVSVRFRKFSWYIRKKIYQLKTFYKPKKKWKLLFFCLKKKSKVNKPKKSISSTSRQLLNLPLFVCLSLFPTINQYLLLSLSLLLLLPLSLSVSLCSCFTHNLCNICSYIISLFKSKKKTYSLR